MNTAVPRRVDFQEQVDDLKAATLGSLGFSTKFISDATGLTPCQVTYRLAKAEIRRRDYRDGDSWEARRVIQSAEASVSQSLKKRLKRALRKHLKLHRGQAA